MAVPQCVCVWRNGHKWKFFTCSATAVVVFAVVIGSIHHQQQQRLQPATGRGQYKLPLHWPAKRRPLRKKSRAKPKRKAANEGKSCHAPKWVKRATGRQTVQTARQTWTRTVAGDRGSNQQTAQPRAQSVGPRRRTLRIRNAHACVW